MAKNKNNILYITGVYFLLQLIGIIFIQLFLGKVFPASSASSSLTVGHVVFVILGILLATLFIVLTNKCLKKRDLPQIYFLAPTLNRMRSAMLGLLIAILIIFLTALGAYLFLPEFNTISTLQLFFRSPFTFLFTMLFPAITEEVMLRGIFLHAFVVLKKSSVGIYVTGIIFGILHVMNLLFLPLDEIFTLGNIMWIGNLVLLGIFLGYVYMHFGLYIAIFFHWAWNASFYQTMVDMEGSPVTSVIFFFLVLSFAVFSARKDKNTIRTY